MGTRLEQNRRKIEQANEIQERGLEQSREDSRQVQEVKGILESMPNELDDDIISAIEYARNAAKGEGSQHMRDVVHSQIEQGYNTANEAIIEANDQAQRSEQAAATFRQASGASEFGRSAAETSASGADGIATEFHEDAMNAQKQMEKTEQDFQTNLDEINS